MPPESGAAPAHATWLRHARSNLARAKAGRVVPDILHGDCCFDAQQAAEKAVKAVLIAWGVDFPKTHAIARLLDIAGQAGIAVPADVRESAALTAYATDARYPGAAEDIDDDEYRDAIRLAEQVVRWAEAAVGPGKV